MSCFVLSEPMSQLQDACTSRVSCYVGGSGHPSWFILVIQLCTTRLYHVAVITILSSFLMHTA